MNQIKAMVKPTHLSFQLPAGSYSFDVIWHGRELNPCRKPEPDRSALALRAWI